MRGKLFKKALAVATSVLMLSGGVSVQPFADIFKGMAITASAESNTIDIEASGQTISDVTTWENCAVNITGSGTVTFSNRISISGNVTLNLEAGITLNADKGIAVHEGNSLTIDGEGTLNANIGYKEYYGAAIGGSNGINAGTIIINGGNINAYGKYYAAAIGGGYYSNGGNIIINGGTVNADSETGKADGAGIGGGICGDGGNITINGGDITAKSYSGTGIGGGYKGSGGNITITGGNVTSTAGNHAAGIGGGCFGNAGTITITGGIINVTSGADGAGIGGGGTSDEKPAGSGGTISINGGQITVTSSGGYGIGAGKSNYNNNNNGAEGTITLSWNESTDFINASSYKGTISFVEGKRFYYDGTTDYVTADELANKLNQKIVPAVANNNSLAFADIQMPRYYITTNGTAVDVSYDVYDYNGSKLTKGTHYTAVIKNSSNEEVSSFDQLGDYTLTVTGTGTTYTGSKSFTFSLVEWDANLSVDGSDHYINFPSDGTKKTVYLGKDQTIKVYDSEGKNGNLVPSDGRLMLYAPEGYALEVTGKTDAQFYASDEYWTWLKAYDGSDETETELITKIDQNSDNISFASAADGMLMRFYVYDGQSATKKYGLDLTVKAVKATPHNITVGTADNGSIASDKATANTNESVTLTVNPADGYLLKRIIVTDTDNGTTLSTIGEDHWYSGSNTVTFKVPNKNVTITPEFTNDLTASGLSTISISPDGVKECVIPEGVTSFNIGGSPVKNGASTTVLQVPNGYRLQAAGNVNFYGNSYDDSELCIYDGSDTSATLLKKKIGYITYNNGNPDIGTQISSSNYMTIYLYEQDIYNVSFTGKINMVYSIDYDLAGGSVESANPTMYTFESDSITLTNPTKDGHIFAGWTGTGLTEATDTVTIAAGSSGNREYSATWKKPLTNSDIIVEAIADQTYAGNAIAPNVTVKDGENTLSLGTDYTIEYSDNTDVGTATATITGIGSYTGTLTKTFTINKATPNVTAPTANTLTYNGNEQELVTAGSTDFGKVLYSLDGETYSEEVPKGTSAGDYTVFYKVEGNDNWNAVEPKTVTAKISYSDGIGEHLMGYSVSLDGDIGVNFYMELDESVIAHGETAYIRFTTPKGSDTETKTVLVKDAVQKQLGGKTYYVFKCNVSAKDMASKITAQMFDGDKAGTEYKYSVKDYADYLLERTEENEEYANAAPLVKAMLNYGTYSQSYFGIEGTAANAGLAEADKALDNVTIPAKFEYDDNASLPTGVTFEGATLSLKSETTLSLYFKGLPAETVFTCDSKTVETAKNGEYVVARIRGIKANELEKDFTVSFEGDSETYNVKYNVMTYCYNVLNSDTDDAALEKVCCALYRYAEAAYAYFGEGERDDQDTDW